MTSLPRWSEGDGPGDPELRAALIDARRGPSQAQLTALAERVAQGTSARQHAAERARTTPWLTRALIGLASVVLVLSAVWWNAQRAERPLPAPAPEARSTQPPIEPAVAPAANAPTAAPPIASEAPPRVRSNTARPKHPQRAQRQVADDIDEVQLLHAARRALLAQPEQALALAEQHAARFAHGMFSEEREAIAVEALFKLGRAAQAKQALTRFLRDYPQSTYRARLVRLMPEFEGAR